MVSAWRENFSLLNFDQLIYLCRNQVRKMAEVELKQSFRDHSEVIKYSQELLQFMSSDDVQQSARTSADTMDKVRGKLAASEQTNREKIEGQRES